MISVVDSLQVSRFLQVYDHAATQRGIKCSIGFDFHEYISITRTTPTKEPTYPNFRPDRSPIKSGEGYWIIGVDKNDEVALLAAHRLYELSNSNFAEHLQSLKAFYAEPAVHRHPQDHCTCIAASAMKMTGRVAYHGDLWVREDVRGQGLAGIVAGVGHGISFSIWAPDYLCACIGRSPEDKGLISKYQLPHHELGGSLTIEEKIVDNYWVMWITGEELRDQVERHDRVALLLALSSSRAQASGT